MVTEKIKSCPNITVVPGEVTDLPEGEVLVASGPLTSDALADRLRELLGADTALHFYDAAAPLIAAGSVDMAKLPVDNTDTFQQWLLEHFEDHGDTVMEETPRSARTKSKRTPGATWSN